MPYTRFLDQRRDDVVHSSERLSDVTRAAAGRIAGGVLMIAVGSGLTYVSSSIFVGLAAGGVILILRALYFWIEDRA